MDRVITHMFELERLKSVTRKTRVIGSERPENSAEHSWQIAMVASALAPFAPALLNLVNGGQGWGRDANFC